MAATPLPKTIHFRPSGADLDAFNERPKARGVARPESKTPTCMPIADQLLTRWQLSGRGWIMAARKESPDAHSTNTFQPPQLLHRWPRALIRSAAVKAQNVSKSLLSDIRMVRTQGDSTQPVRLPRRSGKRGAVNCLAASTFQSSRRSTHMQRERLIGLAVESGDRLIYYGVTILSRPAVAPILTAHRRAFARGLTHL